MKKTLFLGVALLALIAGSAETMWAAPQVPPSPQKYKITLVNGAVVEGEIVATTKADVSIKDPTMGVITIARENILKIEPPLAEETPAVPVAQDPVVQNSVFSGPPVKPLRLFMGVGFTFGGEILATLSMSDGSERNLRAGSLVEIKGGLDFLLNSRISLRAALGAHYGSATASNGSIAFIRFPLEGMAFFHFNEKFSFGAGVRKALGASVFGTGDFEHYFDDLTLESSLGLIIQGEYRLDNMDIVVRYVNERYRVNSFWAWNDGSHIGLEINHRF